MDTPSFDAEETAATQAEYDIDTAIAESTLNKVDEFNPYGSSVYSVNEREVDYDAYNAAIGEYEATGGVGGTSTDWILNPDWTEADMGEDRYIQDTSATTDSAYPKIEDYYTVSDEDYVPSYSRTTEYSEDQQAILDLEEQLSIDALGLGSDYLSRIAGQDPLDIPELSIPGYTGDSALTQALYSDITEQDYLDQETLDTKLANQGIALGSDAYRDAQNVYDESLSDLYLDAGLAAYDTETQNYLTEYGANTENLLTEYYSPYNELASLLGYSSGVSTPSYSGIDAVDIADSNYDTLALAEYNADQETSSALFGDLFSLGGSLGSSWITAAGAGAATGSSRAFKERIAGEADVLDRVKAMPVERWKYIGAHADGQEHIGPYAEDFHQAFGVGVSSHIHLADVAGVAFLAIKALTQRVESLEAR